ncbi:MAG: phosphoribosylaminoimidazolesuccinocarboxamide synthase [Acidobacteria bacterium]|nr:phosphoribosylaminoimidazolesuccinocarboxamide synthase [Acidobacteriota bacterium]
MTYPTVVETNLKGIDLLRRGKVRDVYELPPGRLLIVATDRISAFDSVLASPIPQKGIILNNISLFWFDKSSSLVPNHIIEREVERFPTSLQPYREILAGRSVIVRKTEVVPFECVVRGYLSGSGWKEYKHSRTIGGVALPGGMVESDRLPEPFFSPATKADVGHDINVDEVYMENQIGRDLTRRLKQVSLSLYTLAADYARERGIIIADTKFEFGLDGGELYLIDELLTPDSSRFWPLSEYVPGGPQKSFDKQYVRDYLESSGWDKNPPAPSLPDSITSGTRAKYLAAYRQLIGRELLPA